MDRKTNTKLFWLLHLAFLRKVISESKGNEIKKLEKIGSGIGRRLLDDYCARFLIFEKVDNRSIMGFLKKFTENYMVNVEIENNFVVFKNSLAKYQQLAGLTLMKSILQHVFESINDEIVFSVTGEKIGISFKSRSSQSDSNGL